LTTNQINSYAYAADTANNLNSLSNQNDNSSSSAAKGASSLGMDDFLQLLATQMSNQDVLSPTDNTEFVAQMAQFSSLSALQTLTQTASTLLDATYTASLISYSQYGASLVGKTVIVGYTNDDGTTGTTQGVVDSVNFLSNSNTISVGGKDYDLSSVVKVLSDSGSSDSAAASA
jgi:flagellar hook assembly protein FlgD